MTDATHDAAELEMQILTAQDGTTYLLPRALVEAARLTPEEEAAFHEAERSGDVQGLWYGPGKTPPPGGHSQADMQQLQSMISKHNQMIDMLSNIMQKHAAFKSQIVKQMG